MSIVLNLSRLLLPFLGVAGTLGTAKLAIDNGTLKLLEQASATRTLIDSSTGLFTNWTGMSAVDQYLGLMINLFSAGLNGRNPSLTLQMVHFSGQLIAIYTILIAESFRVSNRFRFISLISLWGLAMELVGAAVVMPLYGFFYLFFSPTVPAGQVLLRKRALLVHPVEMQVVPWTVAIGHLIPVAMVLTTSPEAQSIWQSQQFWILVRLFNPILISVAHLVLSPFIAESSYSSPTQRNREVIRNLQRIYTFALSCAALLHISTVTLAGCSQLFPSMFASEYQAALNPIRVWKPLYFWTDVARMQVTNMATGIGYLLQWDEIIFVASALVWAIAINRQALSDQDKASSFISMSFRILLMTLVGGPAAAVISLIKERDQILLDYPETDEEKKDN